VCVCFCVHASDRPRERRIEKKEERGRENQRKREWIRGRLCVVACGCVHAMCVCVCRQRWKAHPWTHQPLTPPFVCEGTRQGFHNCSRTARCDAGDQLDREKPSVGLTVCGREYVCVCGTEYVCECVRARARERDKEKEKERKRRHARKRAHEKRETEREKEHARASKRASERASKRVLVTSVNTCMCESACVRVCACAHVCGRACCKERLKCTFYTRGLTHFAIQTEH